MVGSLELAVGKRVPRLGVRKGLGQGGGREQRAEVGPAGAAGALTSSVGAASPSTSQGASCSTSRGGSQPLWNLGT